MSFAKAGNHPDSYLTCRISAKRASEDSLRQLGEILQASHRARDGVAASEARRRIENSTVPSVRETARIVRSEGIFKYDVVRITSGFVLDVALER